MPSVAERIKQFNSNRQPQYTAFKYRAMAKDAFTFYRGTAHVFYDDLLHVNPLPASPLAWICGDLHIENFGSYKGDNRLVYFDINDFDESLLAPVAFDLTRMATSIVVALVVMGATNTAAKNMALHFLKTYSAVLAKGRSRYIEPQTASGIVRSFLLKVSERRQKELVKERTIKKDGQLALYIDNERLFKLDRSLRSALCDFAFTWMHNSAHQHQFQVIDAGFRLAGTGSIGQKRYLFLLERVNGERKYLLLDMKHAQQPVLQSQLSVKQPQWSSEAERIVAIQERMQNISPALLGVGIFKNESYVLKEMQPTADKINFAALENRYNHIEDVLSNMALVAASAHLRSSGRQGAAVSDELIEFGRNGSWVEPIINYALQYASQVKTDHQLYLEAYRAGFFK
ncbi:DUF2252 domain-containing protein [Niastella sp. OAS944]|uniref:DUF2252 domain-containing protein n=1 Tax=Niastella sp. OAS944 TaxID=2664089 RepID=UPI00347079C4|nr:uncharacterized protein (DUF2252 family) [Chitinophagaceae bacterium OAS944]